MTGRGPSDPTTAFVRTGSYHSSAFAERTNVIFAGPASTATTRTGLSPAERAAARTFGSGRPFATAIGIAVSSVAAFSAIPGPKTRSRRTLSGAENWQLDDQPVEPLPIVPGQRDRGRIADGQPAAVERDFVLPRAGPGHALPRDVRGDRLAVGPPLPEDFAFGGGPGNVDELRGPSEFVTRTVERSSNDTVRGELGTEVDRGVPGGRGERHRFRTVDPKLDGLHGGIGGDGNALSSGGQSEKERDERDHASSARR